MKFLLVFVLLVAVDVTFSASPSCDPVSKFFEKREEAYEELLTEVYTSIGGTLVNSTAPDLHTVYTSVTGGTDEGKFDRFHDAMQVVLGGYFDACFSSPEERAVIESNAKTLVETFLKDLDAGVNYTEMRNILGKLSCLKTFPNETENSSKRKRSASLFEKCKGSGTIQQLFACVHEDDDSLPCIFDVISDDSCSDDATIGQLVSADCLGFSIDTTGSMSAEISDAKAITLKLVQSEQLKTFCYVMAPFNDYNYNSPATYVHNLDFWKVYDAQSATDGSNTFTAFDYLNNMKQVYGVNTLISDINSLYAHGGGDCPEYGMISLLKSIELIEGLVYSQATLKGKHNIIVLTDASAKDDHLYTQVIAKAQEAHVKVHVFYSGGGCGALGYGHFHDISVATGGLEVTGINQAAFSSFVDFITESSDSTTLPMTTTLCSGFSISPFITSFSALYTTSSSSVKVTDPSGQEQVLYTGGYGFVLHKETAPLPGNWTACVTSGQIVIELKTTGDLQIDVTNVVQEEAEGGDGSEEDVDILPTEQLPIACHNVSFILSPGEGVLSNISLNHSLFLNLVNEDEMVVAQTQLFLCGQGFLSTLMLPYNELLQYQLQGYDIYGNPFKSYLAQRLVDFEVPQWSVTLLEDPVINPGLPSLVRASIALSDPVDADLLADIHLDPPTGVTVQYMGEPKVELIQGMSVIGFDFYITGSETLAVNQNYSIDFQINSSCSADYSVPFNAQAKYSIDFTMTSHTPYEIVFTWVQPSIEGSIFYYKITVEYSQDDIQTIIIDPQSNATSYTLKNLYPYQLVYVGISVLTDAGESAAIASRPFRSDEAEPSQVRSIKSTIISNSSIQLRWEEPTHLNGILLHYEVTINDNQTIITETTQCDIDELEPFIFYEAIVRAVNSAGKGAIASHQFYTEQDTPMIAPPNIRYNFLSPTSINVSWTKIPLEYQRGFLTRYRVTVTEYERDEVVNKRIVSVPPSKSYVVITGLKEFSNFTLQVAAETVPGSGPIDITCCILIVTGVPSAPANCSANIISDESIAFQWEEPADRNGLILAYHLYHETEQLPTAHFMLSYNVSNGTYYSKVYSNDTFGVFQEHNFTIVAENDAGLGINSSLIMVVYPEESIGDDSNEAVIPVVIVLALLFLLIVAVIIIVIIFVRRKKSKDKLGFRGAGIDGDTNELFQGTETGEPYFDLKRKVSAMPSVKEKGIVYSIPCQCGKVYIGESSLMLEAVVAKHQSDIQLGNKMDPISLHVQETGHKMNWAKSTVIIYEEGIQRRRLVQQIHIKKITNNLNESRVNPLYEEMNQDNDDLIDDDLMPLYDDVK